MQNPSLINGDKAVRGAHSITMEIRKVIESGHLAVGEQLPPERDLAENYSASRSTIRKALDNLEAMGLVTRKMGSGTFVNGPEDVDQTIEEVVDLVSPIHLIDARIGFERQMARLAAIHATKRDLDGMRVVLEQMEKSTNDRDAFSRFDSQFHLMIAQATKNPLMIHLYEQINDIRGHDQWKTMKNIILAPSQIRKYNKFHRAIFEALSSRDSAKAIQALNGHMDLARQDLLGAESQL